MQLTMWRSGGFGVAVGVASVLLCTAAAGQLDPASPMYKDTSRLRMLSSAVHEYAEKHEGRLPPDLAALLPYVAEEGESTRDVIRNRADSAGFAGEVPEHVKPEWVNQKSAFAYIGRGDLNLADVPWWDEIAVVHLKLEHSYPTNAGEFNPEGEMYLVGYLNSGCAMMPRSAAERLVAQSKRVLEAMATGGPLPEAFEVMFDLRMIHNAVHAFAKAHGDELPPDFGAMLAHVPDTKRTKTPADRARVFLPPRVEKNLHIPEEPTPEWVNRHAGYVYLGGAGVKLTPIDFFEGPVLVHVKPEDATEPVGGPGPQQFGVARVRGVERGTKEFMDWALPSTRQVMEASRGKGAWPDLAHALRDLKHIDKGIQAYVKAHDGMFPPDLGAVLEFLPEEAGKSAAERARVLLSPRVERVTQPPEDADAEWVAEHASYVYLGKGDLSLKQARREGSPVLIIAHAPFEEEYSIVPHNLQESRRVTPALNWGWAWAFPPEHLKEQVETTRAEVEKVRGK